MRKIKFRAWDGERIFKVVNVKNGFRKLKDKEITTSQLFDEDSVYTPIQYTGLKDKNGVEIYEFMELDNQYEVVYIAPSYVLRDISSNDIITLYDNKHTITKEYTKV